MNAFRIAMFPLDHRAFLFQVFVQRAWDLIHLWFLITNGNIWKLLE